MCRSVKSKYELDILKEAGAIHADIMTNTVPELLTEDISERDAALLIFNEFMQKGHQGIFINMIFLQVLQVYMPLHLFLEAVKSP